MKVTNTHDITINQQIYTINLQKDATPYLNGERHS